MTIEDSPEWASASRLRETNQAIGKAYDEVIFERPARTMIEPQYLFGLAAVYGGLPQGTDVLDLGCGTGRQLEAVGDVMGGRLAGIDISAEAIRLAQGRCGRFGDRVDLRRADLLDLDAANLGKFDLIYNIGVLYVVPAAVRARILELIGTCLKPGGVAVVSYYAGTWYAVRASINRLLRAADDPGAPLRDRLAYIRQCIGELMDVVPPGPQQELLLRILRQLKDTADDTLFHEVLNSEFEALDTPALALALERHGVAFLGYMRGGRTEGIPSARKRALTAGIDDFRRGGYRFAVYGKLPEGSVGADLRAPAIKWVSNLRRRDVEGDWVVYANDDVGIRTDSRETQALLDALAAAPLGWQDMCRAVTPHLGQHVRGREFDTLGRELSNLWLHRFIQPVLPLDKISG